MSHNGIIDYTVNSVGIVTSHNWCDCISPRHCSPALLSSLDSGCPLTVLLTTDWHVHASPPLWSMAQCVEPIRGIMAAIMFIHIWNSLCNIGVIYKEYSTGNASDGPHTSPCHDPSPSSLLSSLAMFSTFQREDCGGLSLMQRLCWEPPSPLSPTATHSTPPQQHTATCPHCSWIIQAGRQATALGSVGEDARTKDGQLTEQPWLSRLGWEDNGN